MCAQQPKYFKNFTIWTPTKILFVYNFKSGTSITIKIGILFWFIKVIMNNKNASLQN